MRDFMILRIWDRSIMSTVLVIGKYIQFSSNLKYNYIVIGNIQFHNAFDVNCISPYKLKSENVMQEKTNSPYVSL